MAEEPEGDGFQQAWMSNHTSGDGKPSRPVHGVRVEIPISPVTEHEVQERGEDMAGGHVGERDQRTAAVTEGEGGEGDRDESGEGRRPTVPKDVSAPHGQGS